MRTDILIIGGGLAGCALAYFLVREGADVLLVERQDVNSLASGANAGSLHVQIPHEPFLLEGEEWASGFASVIPLMLESIDIWKTLDHELGVDLEVSISGGLLVAETDQQMRDVIRKAQVERAQGVKVDVLTTEELRSLAPYVSSRMIGGAFCPHEGKANPLRAAPAFASAARRLGARILTGTGVEALAADGHRFVAATSRGEVTARRVVNCAGAEAGRLARMVGLSLAVEGYPIQVSVTEPVVPLVEHLVYSAGDRLTLKQTRRGAFLIGGGWPAAVDAASGQLVVNQHSLIANLGIAALVVPALAGVDLLRTWPAIVNGTADWRPILGEAPGVAGFFMCMFPWMGFTAGPICARLVADAVMGRRPPRAFAQFFL